MAIVYANDPASAFAQSAQLDQQRVGNYLNSIQANRQAQLQGFEAANRQAALQQEAERRQQDQMLQLASIASQRQQQQQAHQDALSQFAANLGLSREQLAEQIRHNMAGEVKPNASHEKLLFEQQQQQDERNQQADYAAQVADLLNKHAGLEALSAQIPSTPDARSKAMATPPGPDYPPESGGALRAIAYAIPFLPNINRANAAKHARELELKHQIASHVADLPADFSNAQSLSDYADIAGKAIETRIKALGEAPKDLTGLVGLNEHGRHVPLIQRTAPAPLPVLTGGTGNSGDQPSIGSSGRQIQLVNAAEDAIRKGADPAKVAARLQQLLKAGQ